MRASSWVLGVLLGFAAPAQASVTACGPGVDISVSPAAPKVGEPITLTFTNNTGAPVAQTPGCLIGKITRNDCAGPIVFAPFCIQILVLVPPGGTTTFTWDQKDDTGTQVPPGTYWFHADTGDPSAPSGCCFPLVIGPTCSTAPANFGVASPGTGGVLPQLGTLGGNAQVGNAGFQLVVSQARGGSLGALFLGTAPGGVPAPWGIFLLDPTKPLFLAPFSTSGAPGAAGAGNAIFPAPIPPDPALGGITIYFQALVQDPGAGFGIAHTPGLAVPICP